MRHKSSAAITILILASAEPGFFLQSIIIHLLAPNFMGFMKCVCLGVVPSQQFVCAAERDDCPAVHQHSPATLDASSTIRPPPSAPPETWSLAFTNTAACWYLEEGEMPGAIAHSHRPSRCFASPYAVSSGYRQQQPYQSVFLVYLMMFWI
jgi:hypothetical protein